MHESGYFPHLPLNLFISTRAQNFWKKDVNGWLLVLTGWDPPTAGHCISLLLLVGTDGSLYILSSHIFCTIYCLTVSAGSFIVFTFLKHLYSKSWRFFFLFSTTQEFIPIFPHPIFFCTLFSFRGTRHFKNPLLHSERKKKTTQVDFLQNNLRYF